MINCYVHNLSDNKYIGWYGEITADQDECAVYPTEERFYRYAGEIVETSQIGKIEWFANATLVRNIGLVDEATFDDDGNIVEIHKRPTLTYEPLLGIMQKRYRELVKDDSDHYPLFRDNRKEISKLLGLLK